MLSKLKDRLLIAELTKRGYTSYKKPLASGKVHKVDLKRWDGKSYRIGVVSDTHFGSLYTQLTALNACYDVFTKRGITTVLHCGDLTDGSSKMHVGMEFELAVHGEDNTVKYCVDKYPKRTGITTRLIVGNHDLSFWKDGGTDIVKKVCEKRTDLQYLGATLAFTEIGGLKIALMHGGGGNAYARSYRLQKICEQLSPELKPNILLLGHYHTSCILPAYRNIEAVQLGCFQSQTPFLASKGLFPGVSGLIITFVPDRYGLASITYEMLPFYKAVANDY